MLSKTAKNSGGIAPVGAGFLRSCAYDGWRILAGEAAGATSNARVYYAFFRAAIRSRRPGVHREKRIRPILGVIEMSRLLQAP